MLDDFGSNVLSLNQTAQTISPLAASAFFMGLEKLAIFICRFAIIV